MRTRTRFLILEVLERLERLEAMMTSHYENLQESLNAANTSLDEVVTDLHTLVDKIADLKDRLANGLSADEAASVQAELDELVSKLNSAANIFDPEVEPGDDPPPGGGGDEEDEEGE